MLIAMAGMPATGKTTLALRLADQLNGIVLNKDAIRAALFPAPALDYSQVQSDLAMGALYSAAAAILKKNPVQVVILDGRTFLRAYQVRDLFDLAGSAGQQTHIIECMCDDEIARQRLEADLDENKHLAKNRTYELLLSVKIAAEPISIPHLVLDTGTLTLDECVRQSLEYLRAC